MSCWSLDISVFRRQVDMYVDELLNLIFFLPNRKKKKEREIVVCTLEKKIVLLYVYFSYIRAVIQVFCGWSVRLYPNVLMCKYISFCLIRQLNININHHFERLEFKSRHCLWYEIAINTYFLSSSYCAHVSQCHEDGICVARETTISLGITWIVDATKITLAFYSLIISPY